MTTEGIPHPSHPQSELPPADPDPLETTGQPTAAFKEVKKALEATVASIDTEGETTSPTMRTQFLQEAGAILEGLDTPHPQLGALQSRRAMISYSRGDEAKARALSLGLQSAGMIPWLDVQASNVAQPGVQPSPPMRDGTRGIGFGFMWEEALEHAPPESGYGLVMLTHKALDKFDIVGGVEIPRMLQVDAEIVVAHSDERNEQGKTVLERVQEMAGIAERAEDSRPSYGPALQAIITAVNQGSEIALHPEYFEGSPRDLGNFVVDSLARSPDAAFVNTAAQEAHASPDAHPSDYTEAITWDTTWTRVQEQLDTLQRTISPEDLQGMRSFEEARILIEGVAQPQLVAARLEDKGFYTPGAVVFDAENGVNALKRDLVGLGLENRTQQTTGRGTALLPISEQRIREQWPSFANYLLGEFGSGGTYSYASQGRPNPTIWQIWDGNVPGALAEVGSEVSTAEWLSSQQAIFDSLSVHDPGLAACLVTKQALVEVAKRYQRLT